MASELRVNSIKNRSGLGTVTFADEGLLIAGITSLSLGNTTLIVGSATSTGTANQTLQVTGGGYVSGNTGIGTTSPQYALDVLGDINLTGTFRQNGSQFVASRWTSGTGDDIYRLSGDVGIGTTNPTSKLSVTGDVIVTGVVTATSFSGNATTAGYATTAGIATVAQGLTGTPSITVNNVVGAAATFTGLVGINTSSVTGSATSEGVVQAVGTISISDGVYMMDADINTNVTVPAGKNALMIGPITVGTGYTVLVESGSTLVVV